MFWCCGTAANVEVPVPNEKLTVNVPVVSKPITLMSRAPPVDQHIVVVPIKKEEITVCVDEVNVIEVEKKCPDYTLTKGVAAVALLATAVYCISNTENAVSLLTPAHTIYSDFF